LNDRLLRMIADCHVARASLLAMTIHPPFAHHQLRMKQTKKEPDKSLRPALFFL
jgi:hypothetical protein